MTIRLGLRALDIRLIMLVGGTTSTITILAGHYRRSCPDKDRRPQPAGAR